jgi:putative transposase
VGATGKAVRFPEPGWTLADVFLFEAERKVQKDRTVSLNGVVYEVDAALVGEKVTLRFDPGAPPERPSRSAMRASDRAGPPGADLCQLLRQTRSPVLDLECRRPGAAAAPSALRLRELPDRMPTPRSR